MLKTGKLAQHEQEQEEQQKPKELQWKQLEQQLNQ